MKTLQRFAIVFAFTIGVMLALCAGVSAQSASTSRVVLAKSEDFIERVQFAAVKIALDVSAEAPATANHARRVAYARQVLQNPEQAARNMALGVAANTSISASVVSNGATGPARTATTTATDSDIEFTVSSIWNAYAGVL